MRYLNDLKMRLWDTEGGAEMITDIDKIEEILGDISIFQGEDHIDRYIFIQYTGLKDTSGKEIYEGDVIEIEYLSRENKGEIGFVRYFHSGFMFENKEGDLLPLYDLSGDTISEIVLGNIYENPELLKGKNDR
jgi:uncharacterized phage protein (TIGR01671 family)